MLPEDMQDAIYIWVQYGLPAPNEMGSFMRSVLLHDLMGAAAHANLENRHMLFEWAEYLHNEVPALAHGSAGRLLDWHARGGLIGRQAA